MEKKRKKAQKAAIRKKLVNEKEIAAEFAQKVHEKFDRLVKASILFGSQAKNTQSASSDIDIIFIVDDASIDWDLELISWYREELGKIIALKSKDYNRDLHINTIKLTTFWQDLMRGDPVVMNILRFGEALIDSGGFFIPLKALLLQGKIYSTPEAAYAALQRAPNHLARSRIAELGAIEGIYWSMVDSGQAALIMAGKLTPSPEHLPESLKETFVDTGLLKVGFVNAIRDLYILHKQILHGDISNLPGSEIDKWQKIAEDFLSEMTRIINKLVETRK